MRVMASLLFFILIGWCIGLTLFVRGLQDAPVTDTVHADAIVVLTGGNGRVERGLSLLAEGTAPLLFISGVGEKVSLAEILQEHATPSVRQAIALKGNAVMLGRTASTTRTNAQEVALFARARSAYRLRIVTAHYHMPRSLLEIHHALPEATLIADPVFPDGFKRDEWWKHQNTRRLMLVEYHKYIAALLRMLV